MKSVARHEYLGSADAASLANVPPYGCRRQLVYKKTGVPVDDAERHRDKFDNPMGEGPVLRGIEMEPLIRDVVSRRIAPAYKWDTSEGQALIPPRTNLPAWLKGTPDSAMLPLTDEQHARLVAWLRVRDSERLRAITRKPIIREYKTVQRTDLWRARKQGPRPDQVIQTQHQLATTEAEACLLIVMNADDWAWSPHLIERDPEWERESYVPAAIQAWAEITRAKSGIQLGASPDEWEAFLPARLEEGSKQCRGCSHKRTCWGPEYFRVMDIPVEGDLPDLNGDPEWESACHDLIEAKEVYDEAEALKKDAEERIKARLGDLPGAQGGGLRVYFKPSTQKRLDTTALKKALPEVAAQFTKEIPIRALRTYQV